LIAGKARFRVQMIGKERGKRGMGPGMAVGCGDGDIAQAWGADGISIFGAVGYPVSR